MTPSTPKARVPAWILVVAGVGLVAVVLAGIGLFALGLGGGDRSNAATADVRPQAPTTSTKPSSGGTTILGDREGSAAPAPTDFLSKEPSPFRFADILKESGIDFVEYSGMTPERHFPSANGSGVAIFDFDNDGKMDLYFATCTRLPLGSYQAGPNRLYKNLGDGKFEDVTDTSGLGFRGFCHGIVVGDIDNDGDQDVFLACYGQDALFENKGDGTFRDISKAAGIDRPVWSSGGAFLDYDQDGDLDLYVSNYGEWDLKRDDEFCGDKERNIRLYCSPRTVRTVKHILYRNDFREKGTRTFTDVTDAAGVGRKDKELGHGFGVLTADFNGDGLVDIYVANDMNPNFVFLNKGDGTFEDVTETSGAAYNENGLAQSGMGVDCEDIDGDLRPELFVTNFANEYNTMYQNTGGGLFVDVTTIVGLAADSMPWVGWGCALADFDNDGWPDVFVANGHVDNNRRQIGQQVDYEEPPLLHRNLQGAKFQLSNRDVGTYFATKHVARGVAYGDLDNDGDIDLVVNHKDAAPAILRNDTPTSNRWIRLDLAGTTCNRDAIGTRVEVELPTELAKGKKVIFRQRKGGCSLEAANDPRLLIGVGPNTEIARLKVQWAAPSKQVTVLEHVKTNQVLKLVEPKPGS